MIQKLLLMIGTACLGLYGFFTVQARIEQRFLEEELYRPRPAPVSKSEASRVLREGDLFGRLEIPRLTMTVMVMEGTSARTLRLGAGRVAGTSLAVAAHRDTFFRPLKDIRMHDTIRLTTPEGSAEYRVTSVKIVGPKDSSVLENEPPDTLTLITCYPFYYIGPAPKRFIVQAAKIWAQKAPEHVELGFAFYVLVPFV